MVAGQGRLGSSLFRALAAADLSATLLPGRTLAEGLPAELESEEPAVVLLAVPDAAVPGLARQLASALPGGRQAAVVHLSGALGLDSLAALGEAGQETGSFHPLQSFAREQSPAAFSGILVAIDGSSAHLRDLLTQLASALGARARRVADEQRPLYHAAAAMASNYVLTLVWEAARALEAAGWRRGEALQDLLPLVTGTIGNLERMSATDALTGPIRRGDAATVRRHLAALERELPGAAGVYRIVGLAALELAREAGLAGEAAAEIDKALTRQGSDPEVWL